MPVDLKAKDDAPGIPLRWGGDARAINDRRQKDRARCSTGALIERLQLALAGSIMDWTTRAAMLGMDPSHIKVRDHPWMGLLDDRAWSHLCRGASLLC